MPVGAVTSIGHRISGVVLAVSVPAAVYLFALSLRDDAGFAQVMTLTGRWAVQGGGGDRRVGACPSPARRDTASVERLRHRVVAALGTAQRLVRQHCRRRRGIARSRSRVVKNPQSHTRLTGLRAWWVQRASAVGMLLFVLFLLNSSAVHPMHTHSQWRDWVARPAITLAFGLFFTALLAHMWVGLRDVLLDYARPAGRRAQRFAEPGGRGAAGSGRLAAVDSSAPAGLSCNRIKGKTSS